MAKGVLATAILAAGIAAMAGSLAGCSTEQYRYVPSEHQATQGRGYRLGEAIYAEPSSLPQGQVRVLSSGIVTLKSKDGSKSFQALHVRMIFSNQTTNQTWTIDGANQVVSFANQGPNQGPTQPVFVNSDANSLPVLQVRPRELRVWDLYFPLPEQEKSAKDVPAFDFHWSFQAGPTAVAETTPFERAPIPEGAVVYPDEPYPYYLGFGWGGYWWSGPRARAWMRVPG